MSEDKLMAKIKRLNGKIDDLCYQRDDLIQELNELRDLKRRTESD